MATGAGKTLTAITSVYRLLKFGGAKRILFLVDTRNLGKQAHQEFMAYTPPDDGRKFTELYNVQRLASPNIDPHSQVCISTIQRKNIPKGSVAIAMYGATIGKTSIIGIDAATNQACAVGFPEATSAEFLYYFQLSQEKTFVDAGKGGAQPNTSQGIIKAWPSSPIVTRSTATGDVLPFYKNVTGKTEGTYDYRAIVCVVGSNLCGTYSGVKSTTVAFPKATFTRKVSYYHADLLGSTVAMTDESGNRIYEQNQVYKPFGEKMPNAGAQASENEIWYTAKPHDEDIGLTYMNARYYDPVVGRFMGVDPVGPIAGGLQHFNRYSYAYNNPYAYIDPDGRQGQAFGFSVRSMTTYNDPKMRADAGIKGMETALRDSRSYAETAQTAADYGTLGAIAVGQPEIAAVTGLVSTAIGYGLALTDEDQLRALAIEAMTSVVPGKVLGRLDETIEHIAPLSPTEKMLKDLAIEYADQQLGDQISEKAAAKPKNEDDKTEPE